MNKKVMMLGVIVIFVVGAIAGNFAVKMFRAPPEPSEETQTLIGSPSPEFSLLDLDGVRENSKDWIGKVQVINFWATWCPPCKREIPGFIELQEKYRRHGLHIVGIATQDSLEQVQSYADEAGINYLILNGGDESIKIAEQHGNDMGLLPYTVIIDQTGNIRHVHYGEIDRDALESEIKPLF